MHKKTTGWPSCRILNQFVFLGALVCYSGQGKQLDLSINVLHKSQVTLEDHTFLDFKVRRTRLCKDERTFGYLIW